MWLYGRRRPAVLAAAVVALGGIGVGAYLLVQALRDNSQPSASPAPKVVVEEQQPQAAQDLGFPAFATKNTTRVAGADPIADAAGVALAVFPSDGGLSGPAAVTLVDDTDWPSGIAAASLMAAPIGAPILITSADSVPGLTADALRALAPAGAPATNHAQVFRIGAAAAPSGVRTTDVRGSNPAQLAAAIDRLRQSLSRGQPQHILLVSSDSPQFSMPAAAWAARSGDPVLFLRRDSAPKPTLAALRRHRQVPVFALGPPSAISDNALKEVQRVSPGVSRIEAQDPVRNAIEFARYASGTFGWDIRDPGHGFVIASDARPLDAAAAAALSASGNWGPLLVTDDGQRVPDPLRGYLLDVKPGYVTDPTRAVYNHLWLMGDQDAISAGFQAQVDDLAEVAKVRSGTGATRFGPAPGAPGRAPTKGSRSLKP